MLSFEMNQAVFDQEVGRALDNLYLNDYLDARARTLEQQKDTAQALKEKQAKEVFAAKDGCNEAVRSVPGLHA